MTPASPFRFTINPAVLVLALLTLGTHRAAAQSRIGYISMSELIQAMPEFKKADSSLSDYQRALSDKYEEMVATFKTTDSDLSTPDTLHFTKEQLVVKRQSAGELYSRIQGFSQQVSDLLQARQNELLAPIRKKANDLIWELAKEHGYTLVLLKESVAVYPPADDLMPYAKLKLGLK